MGNSDDTILGCLRAVFPDGPPSDAEVRSQAFDVIPRQWSSEWPKNLALPVFLDDGELRTRVSRQELLSLAPTVDDRMGAVDLYVRMAGWGAGTQARPVARCMRVLHQPEASNHLFDSMATVRKVDPAEAYRTLTRGGRHKIKFFGPAFFTKWIYFLGYEQRVAQGAQAPLILDALVASALGWGSTGWTADHYAAYLSKAQMLQDRWQAESPHVVEYGLFQVGRAMRSKARVTRG